MSELIRLLNSDDTPLLRLVTITVASLDPFPFVGSNEVLTRLHRLREHPDGTVASHARIAIQRAHALQETPQEAQHQTIEKIDISD